jgi:hypothetical protein
MPKPSTPSPIQNTEAIAGPTLSEG